jgi:hypothetical protein
MVSFARPRAGTFSSIIGVFACTRNSVIVPDLDVEPAEALQDAGQMILALLRGRNSGIHLGNKHFRAATQVFPVRLLQRNCLLARRCLL